MRKLALLFFLIPAAYAGFKWGPAVFPMIERFLVLDPVKGSIKQAQPSAALSDLTLNRFEKLRWGELGDSLVLGDVELSSVARYAVPGIIPPGLLEPMVELQGERVGLSALVLLDAFPGLPRLDEIVGFLPDTITVEMQGVLVPLDDDHLSLIIDRLWMAKIPIPSSLIPAILTGFGREGPRALPRDALLVPKPDGIESVFIRADSLILLVDSETDQGARGGGI